jgi:phosphopantothenoylcysteine synthetase/decarboxylase
MPRKPHTLVTAGPTREMIDQVRDWGNIFSGQTRLDLALAFLDLGDVTFLTSNPQHAREYDGFYGKAGMLGAETFRSHADLHDLLAHRMTDTANPTDVVAMTAAVADYAPAGTYRVLARTPNADGTETWTTQNVDAPKVKSTHPEIAVLGKPTQKLIDRFRAPWNFRGILIKFKLEVALTDDQLLAVAAASRTASHADLIVANTLAMARPADGAEGAAYLIDDTGSTRVARTALAPTIVQWTLAHLHIP